MSKNDDSAEETGAGSPDSGRGASGKQSIPRLTVGQRVLTALPNLQRQPKAPPKAPPGRPAGGARSAPPKTDPADSGTGNGSDEIVEADEILAPGSDRDMPGGARRDAYTGPTTPQPQRGAPSGMSKEELTAIIKRLDDRERFLALVSAPLGVVVTVLLTIGAFHFNAPLHHKGHLTTGFILFESGARVLLSGVVAFAAVSRRRSFTAFALLFLGTSVNIPFALPFWGLGIWLIFRVFKWQKELSTITRGTPTRGTTTRGTPTRGTSTSRPESKPRGGSDAAARRRAQVDERRRARADRMAARSGGRGAKNKKPEPPGPPPSKRYTPPKTIRPKPPIP